MKLYDVYDRKREAIAFSTTNKGMANYQLRYLESINDGSHEYEIRETEPKEVK